MAARIESHITVLYEAPDLDRLRDIARRTPPLRLRVTRTLRWPEPDPGVALAVDDPHGDLVRLRDLVSSGGVVTSQPHVTVLHRDSVGRAGQADEAWEALRDVAIDADVTVTELAIYEEVDGIWRDAGRVALGPTSS